jgi:hypothetical protein
VRQLMDKFQRTSITPRSELLTTPRWANGLGVGGGGDGDASRGFDIDVFDKVQPMGGWVDDNWLDGWEGWGVMCYDLGVWACGDVVIAAAYPYIFISVVHISHLFCYF